MNSATAVSAVTWNMPDTPCGPTMPCAEDKGCCSKYTAVDVDYDKLLGASLDILSGDALDQAKE